MNCTLQQSWRHSNQSVSDDPGAVRSVRIEDDTTPCEVLRDFAWEIFGPPPQECAQIFRVRLRVVRHHRLGPAKLDDAQDLSGVLDVVRGWEDDEQRNTSRSVPHLLELGRP